MDAYESWKQPRRNGTLSLTTPRTAFKRRIVTKKGIPKSPQLESPKTDFMDLYAMEIERIGLKVV